MILKPGDAVLVIGSGPIRIGQGCEFDYSCTQACRALKEQGLRVLLVNPNPATIMTDPETADEVFLEPLSPEFVTQIIEKRRPQGLLATMGGQEGLNLALELDRRGVLSRFGLELLGISPATIEVAEDREKFKQMLETEGFGAIPGCVVTKENLEELEQLTAGMEFPLIIRASFTLGGAGGATVTDSEQLRARVAEALQASSDHPVTIEQSIVGWREFELEVMADAAGSFVVVAAVENINPMGVHTGDSITVVPTFTLRDTEFQNMRDAARAIFRALGMRIGGANIQFAIHPETGQMVVVEMNPRVSRSSALVSKATGYPIAYISTLLALGYRLDELPNEITGQTCAAYEPVIDYVAVKIPKFNFEKISPSDGCLGISMKSVGEVLAFGSNLMEAMTKAWRSLESGFQCMPDFDDWTAKYPAMKHLSCSSLPNVATLPLIKTWLKVGRSESSIVQETKISSFFIAEFKEVFAAEQRLIELNACEQPGDNWVAEVAKFTDVLVRSGYPMAWFLEKTPALREIVSRRLNETSYRLVDSCAGEFEAKTPYFYSTSEGFLDENRLNPGKPSVVILGSGPNRIGQGIEFDYACVHSALAVKAAGYQAVMINSNPETVSTDFKVADKLYVEALDLDSVLNVLRAEKPIGVLLQFGGQTPIQLASAIESAGFTVLGSSTDAIALCENRDRFEALLRDCGFKSPACQSYARVREVLEDSSRPPYPVLLRPSYVIGGQGMQVAHCDADLRAALQSAPVVSEDSPLIVQEFLEGGVEYDFDIICDGVETQFVGILRHLDPPGIHSGDSIGEWVSSQSEEYGQLLAAREACQKLALRLGVRGFLNVQLVLRNQDIYILEANPRASRTVPFLAKAKVWEQPMPIGQSFVALGTMVCLGKTFAELREAGWVLPDQTETAHAGSGVSRLAFKFPVFPYSKFPLPEFGPGPEMHSLGEVMGQGATRLEAFFKGALAALWKFPSLDCKLNLSRPLILWFDSKETESKVNALLTEVEFLWSRAGVPVIRAFSETDRRDADVYILLDYFKSISSNPSLRCDVAFAIGAGKPVLFGYDSAMLTLNVLAMIAADESGLSGKMNAGSVFHGLSVESLPILRVSASSQEGV